VLVNAAGITHYSPLFVTTPSLIYEMVQTNLVGTMQMCKTIGRNMMGSKDGLFPSAISPNITKMSRQRITDFRQEGASLTLLRCLV
jgi:NAD(P)-dependent dehydrogenase (short-subunit alcohol dehydrogenase family)